MRFQRCENCRQATIEIGQYIGIPKSQDPVTIRGQGGVAPNIALAFGMLPAVNFNDELLIPADEVSDEWVDRRLPDELEPPSRRSRNANHSFISASVDWRRKQRVRLTTVRFGPRIQSL